MNFIIDIDDTLIKSEKFNCEHCNRINYKKAIPIIENVRRVNELFDEGNTIILYTGRNWDVYEKTKNQLREIGIKYNELVMGKPQGIIIDDMAYNSFEDYFEKNK